METEITFNKKAGGKDGVLGDAHGRAAQLSEGMGSPAVSGSDQGQSLPSWSGHSGQVGRSLWEAWETSGFFSQLH